MNRIKSLGRGAARRTTGNAGSRGRGPSSRRPPPFFVLFCLFVCYRDPPPGFDLFRLVPLGVVDSGEREGAFEFLRWKLRFAASCTRHLRGDISQRREMDFRSCFRGADAIRGRGRGRGRAGGNAISLCLPNWMGGWGLGRELLPLQICLSFRHLQIRGEENSSSAQVLYASESDASLPLNSYGLTSYSSSSPANAAGSALERSVGRSLATCHGPGGTVAGVHGRLP